ncbi:MAG: hypothetical protein AB1762_02745 [Gemmatimonadota bacterium]
MATAARPIRDGGVQFTVTNSGLEVWLYDDANRTAIRKFADEGHGGAPGRFDQLAQQGLVVGYGLQQDDELNVAVYVGAPFTKEELSAGHWLEPQTAFLRLPSGKLCIESNDASRIGPESPSEKGALTSVPPGDYKLTLYRVDHEALFREEREWSGPQEIILLSPGGSEADAVDNLIPFESRRDTNWVGKYTITGTRAEVLIWFNDYWDTFTINLDAAAIAQLGLASGMFIRTHVPAAGLTLVSAFAESWQAAQRVGLPAGMALDEFGYAAPLRMADWNGAEALFCRRETSKMRVEAPLHAVWTPGTVEVLDVKAAEVVPRAYAPTTLADKQYYDEGFLSIVLSEVLPELEDREDVTLQETLDLLDDALGALGFASLGDFTWHEPVRAQTVEMSCRLYAGPKDAFAAYIASPGCFEVVFLSELANGNWVVTGFADELQRRVMRVDNKGLYVQNSLVHFQTMDAAPSEIFEAHKEAVEDADERPLPVPTTATSAQDALTRFLVAMDKGTE